MELNINELLKEEMSNFSGSIAELGDNAAKITWNNAMAQALKTPLLTNDEMYADARSYFLEFGAWSQDELNAMTVQELNALTIQVIAGDIRQNDEDRHFIGDDGNHYYYLGL